jgi:hypothetical protein
MIVASQSVTIKKADSPLWDCRLGGYDMRKD